MNPGRGPRGTSLAQSGSETSDEHSQEEFTDAEITMDDRHRDCGAARVAGRGLRAADPAAVAAAAAAAAHYAAAADAATYRAAAGRAAASRRPGRRGSREAAFDPGTRHPELADLDA